MKIKQRRSFNPMQITIRSRKKSINWEWPPLGPMLPNLTFTQVQKFFQAKKIGPGCQDFAQICNFCGAEIGRSSYDAAAHLLEAHSKLCILKEGK